MNYVNRLPVEKMPCILVSPLTCLMEAPMETPWAVVRQSDQLPGSCYNWFTVQRWVDISNDDYGVLWSPVHAPMQVGAITANLQEVFLGSMDGSGIESQTIYSGLRIIIGIPIIKLISRSTPFKYVIAVHLGGYDGAKSARFGQEVRLWHFPAMSSLMVVRARGIQSRLEYGNFVIETFKVSEDGEALIYRLRNMAETEQIRLIAGEKKSEKIY